MTRNRRADDTKETKAVAGITYDLRPSHTIANLMCVN